MTPGGDRCGRVLMLLYNTVNLVILACLNFRELLIFGLFAKFRIREIIEFASLSSSRNLRKLKPREYYQIYIQYTYENTTLSLNQCWLNLGPAL